MGVRLHGRDGFGKPAQGKVCGDGAHIRSLFVQDGLAVGEDHLVLDGFLFAVFVQEGLCPGGMAQQFGQLVPVHIEIFVGFAAFLLGHHLPHLPFGVDGVVSASVPVIIRFKGNGAAGYLLVVLHDGAGIDVGGVRSVQVAGDQPAGVVGGHFHLLQDVVHAEGRVVQQLGGVVHRFVLHGLAGLFKEEDQRHGEYDGGQDGHHEIESSGEGCPEKVQGIIDGIYVYHYRARICS